MYEAGREANLEFYWKYKITVGLFYYSYDEHSY
jgi:hypothetical protein